MKGNVRGSNPPNRIESENRSNKSTNCVRRTERITCTEPIAHVQTKETPCYATQLFHTFIHLCIHFSIYPSSHPSILYAHKTQGTTPSASRRIQSITNHDHVLTSLLSPFRYTSNIENIPTLITKEHALTDPNQSPR